MFSLLVGRPGMKSDLAGLSLNQEASQKELEGVRKMAQRRTLPRRSGGSESTAKNISTLPSPTLKKAENKHSSIFNCLTFIEVFRELSKHTTYLSYGRCYFWLYYYFHEHPMRIVSDKMLMYSTAGLYQPKTFSPVFICVCHI
jgi:hypothetical protein